MFDTFTQKFPRDYTAAYTICFCTPTYFVITEHDQAELSHHSHTIVRK